MRKDTAVTICFIILAVIIGLSNCGCTVWTAMVSACVGYTCGHITNYIDNRFF